MRKVKLQVAVSQGFTLNWADSSKSWLLHFQMGPSRLYGDLLGKIGKPEKNGKSEFGCFPLFPQKKAYWPPEKGYVVQYSQFSFIALRRIFLQ